MARSSGSAHAQVLQGGVLEWADGHDRTPEALREKLKRARALAQIRAAATTLDVVAEAMTPCRAAAAGQRGRARPGDPEQRLGAAP